MVFIITFFSGTPGSGKSLETAHEVEFALKTLKKNVIANVQYNRDFILMGKEGGRFFYLDNVYFSPDFFYKYALKYHDLGKESQTLVVIDEAQILYSPTACKLFSQENPHYRQDWLEFYSIHRHLGYDFIIVSQFDRLIDSQLRCLFEYNCVHRKANNFKLFGQLLTIFKIKLFVQIQYWYGCNEKCQSKLFIFKKKYSKIYNSYAYRDKIVAKLREKYGDEFVDRLLKSSDDDKEKVVKKEFKKEVKKVKNRVSV